MCARNEIMCWNSVAHHWRKCWGGKRRDGTFSRPTSQHRTLLGAESGCEGQGRKNRSVDFHDFCRSVFGAAWVSTQGQTAVREGKLLLKNYWLWYDEVGPLSFMSTRKWNQMKYANVIMRTALWKIMCMREFSPFHFQVSCSGDRVNGDISVCWFCWGISNGVYFPSMCRYSVRCNREHTTSGLGSSLFL